LDSNKLEVLDLCFGLGFFLILIIIFIEKDPGYSVLQEKKIEEDK